MAFPFVGHFSHNKKSPVCYHLATWRDVFEQRYFAVANIGSTLSNGDFLESGSVLFRVFTFGLAMFILTCFWFFCMFMAMFIVLGGG